MSYQKKVDIKAEYKEKYGIDWMSLVDELKFRKKNPFMAKTRICKYRLVTVFTKLRNVSNFYIEYCKHIPLEEQQSHAERVEKLTLQMEEFERNLCKMINDAIYS